MLNFENKYFVSLGACRQWHGDSKQENGSSVLNFIPLIYDL